MNKSIEQSSKLIFYLSILWALVLLLLGIWWMYLIFNFEQILRLTDHAKIAKMLIWEGGTFFTLLFLLSGSLFILFVKDQKKTKSIQEFFASLTHELKTPLASIKLQSEVLNELIEFKNDQSLLKLSNRMIEDTSKLENQMDKILQLSRIERGGELNLTTFKIYPFIKKVSQKWEHHFNVTVSSQDVEQEVIADEFALELIFKNLFENSRIHAKSKNVHIEIEQIESMIKIKYFDEGKFSGDINKLGTLFYKHNSKKGSGIGLYLSYKLLNKMNGQFNITNDPLLEFEILLLKPEEINA